MVHIHAPPRALLAWIWNGLLNSLVLLLLLSKLPNESQQTSVPYSPVYTCNAQVLMCFVHVCFVFQFIKRSAYSGFLFLCVCCEVFYYFLFPSLISTPPVYLMLYFRKPFTVLESYCPYGDVSMYQMLGRWNQLFIVELAVKYLLHTNNPQGYQLHNSWFQEMTKK